MRIGIDLGGTKTEIVALHGDDSEMLRRRVPTPREDYDATVRTIAELVTAAELEIGSRCSVGVGTPGALSAKTGRIKNANSTWLIDRPLREDLERALARPIRMTNDANCLALSEAHDGAASGATIAFAVILGTGVGGGIAIDGRVHNGPNAIAGEWGHIPLPWPEAEEYPGPACYCGRRGCLETWLCGAAFAREDDSDRYVDRLARGLSVVTDILDPDIIVLGGGVSNAPGIIARTSELIGRYVFSDSFETPIRLAQHGDASGVRGAALLW